jgi:hypothetical protein
VTFLAAAPGLGDGLLTGGGEVTVRRPEHLQEGV